MKKFILFLIIFICILSSVNAFSLGYGVSTSGTAGKLQSASFNIKGVCDFTKSKQLLLTCDAGFGNNSSLKFGLNNIDFKLSFYPVVFSKHIFSFMFINSMAYAPGVGVGVMLDRSFNHYYTINLDLIHLYDTQYVYDFLSPMIYFDKEFKYSGWGIELFSMSVLFGGR